MALSLVGVFVVAFVLTLVGTRCVRGFAPRLGWIDEPSEAKIHAQPTPYGGGVAIFGGIWLVLWGAVGAVYAHEAGLIELPEVLAPHVQGILERVWSLLWVFLGAAALAVVGLIDDKKSLSPWLRLAVQFGVAAWLVFADGQTISLFIENRWVCAAITVLWIVVITNTFNLLDNMDGLSAGVAWIVAGLFMVVALQTGQLFVAALCIVMMGALAGFLAFNFPPASIFMGDCGSTMIGYMLAVVSINATFYLQGRPDFPIVVPLLILSVPLFDTGSVVLIRLEQGRSPFSGDHNHFSHRLVALGMSRRQAVLTIYMIAAAIGLGATIIYHATMAGALIVLVQAAVVFAVIAMLERAGRLNQ